MTQVPNNEQNESLLSSLIDDELNVFERNHGYEKASADIQKMERYQLVGQLMRQEAVDPSVSLLAGISSAIAKEESHGSVNDTNSNVVVLPVSSVWKKVGGMAVAASVAFVALIGTMQTTTDQNVMPTTNTFAAVGESMANENAVELSTPSQQQRQELQTLHDMFVTHQQIAQLTGVNALPTVRVVSNRKAVPVTVNTPMISDAEREAKALEEAEKEKHDKELPKDK